MRRLYRVDLNRAFTHPPRASGKIGAGCAVCRMREPEMTPASPGGLASPTIENRCENRYKESP